jgi:hypothetical protein
MLYKNDYSKCKIGSVVCGSDNWKKQNQIGSEIIATVSTLLATKDNFGILGKGRFYKRLAVFWISGANDWKTTHQVGPPPINLIRPPPVHQHVHSN